MFEGIVISGFKAGIVGSSSTSGKVDGCGMLILSESSMLVIVTVSTSGEDMVDTIKRECRCLVLGDAIR